MSELNHKEMTAHIRKRVKAAGIKARVRKYDSCGSKWIHVFPVRYDLEFTEDEAREIRLIAHANKLTFARGMEIDHSVPGGTQTRADFVFWG